MSLLTNGIKYFNSGPFFKPVNIILKGINKSLPFNPDALLIELTHKSQLFSTKGSGFILSIAALISFLSIL